MDKKTRQTSAGRPPDPAKRAAILVAAQELFALHGFSATAMDAVARRAGTSKLTAYRHFGSKDRLFAEAVTARCASMLGHFDAGTPRQGDQRDMLVAFGHAFLGLILHREALAVHRLIIGEFMYAPDYRSEVKLWTPEGEQTFPVLRGKSRFSTVREGDVFRLELNEAGHVVDVHKAG